MSNLLGGLQGTAYLGTNANQPPNCNFNKRDPVSTDVNYSLNDFWLNTVNEDVWVLVSLQGGPLTAGQVATWVKLTQGSTGNVEQFTTDDANIVLPLAGNVNLQGGANLNTTGATPNTATFNLNTSILQPFTNNTGTQGVYALGATSYTVDRFLHGYGTGNTFVGYQSGNLSLTIANASENTAVGSQTLGSLTLGRSNTVVGALAAVSISSGSFNTILGEGAGTLLNADDNVLIGFGAGTGILTGTANVIIGTLAGSNLAGAESNNIILGNTGDAGVSDRIRIGSTQTSAYMAGVYGVAVGAGELPMVMDNTGKMGTGAGSGGPILTTTNFGTMFSQPAYAYVFTPGPIAYPLTNGVTYFMGGVDNTAAAHPMTITVNIGANLTPGAGLVPATYTVPVTGTYAFTFLIGMGSAGGSGNTPGVNPMSLYVNGVEDTSTVVRDVGWLSATSVSSYTFSSFLSLTATNVVTFAFVPNNNGYFIQGQISIQRIA